jgi:toxin-antitoxin system PIN domain toxin
MIFLPDINLWLALAVESHIHHTAAVNWFEAVSNDDCLFCRMTQQGFLRLLTNPKAMGKDAVSLPQAWLMYDALLRDPRVAFAREPVGLELLWRSYTAHQSFSPKIWNDAYLAAFARAAGFQLVTFDRGFAQFANLDCIILP